MVSTKNRSKSPGVVDAPAHKTRAAHKAAVERGPPAAPKARFCKTCHRPMRGHSKTECALSKNSPAAIDAKVAECEQVALAAHTDHLSRRIDEVVALVIEASDGEADTAAILAAIAEAGLVIPEGKTLADFVPSGTGIDSDDSDDDAARGTTPPGGRDITPAPPGDTVGTVESLSTPPTTPRPNGNVAGDAADGSRDVVVTEPMDVDAVNPPTPPTTPPATLTPQAPVQLVKTTGKGKTPKYRLKYGWKATPSGILPLELARNGLKRQEYPTQAEKAKHIPRMFQAMAQKGDTLASRTNGWAFCVFMPRGGAGLMRTWHSQQVESDVPGLLSEVRHLVFEKLQPFSEQYLKSLEESNKKAQEELEFWKARAAKSEQEAAVLRKKYGVSND
ncbi:hypothetical protein AURDEDRAFT_174414 [Auricularia subglabra TFB-10046 SS5]|uniref:Uncharacterized protein n=1 Tax=Auricularia subglabra (strain TFB-10046 / SS5) TaxID=717982 RepID=J0LGD6_AURST|nr:hypothetical protein AURDEDRAFT_174414 [Auricularia subglabra TFB-10046 SS5]